MRVVVQVGDALRATRVRLSYRVKGQVAFTELAMERTESCGFDAAIPPPGVAELVHYYVTASDDDGAVLARHGSAISPHVIEVLRRSPR